MERGTIVEPHANPRDGTTCASRTHISLESAGSRIIVSEQVPHVFDSSRISWGAAHPQRKSCTQNTHFCPKIRSNSLDDPNVTVPAVCIEGYRGCAGIPYEERTSFQQHHWRVFALCLVRSRLRARSRANVIIQIKEGACFHTRPP